MHTRAEFYWQKVQCWRATLEQVLLTGTVVVEICTAPCFPVTDPVALESLCCTAFFLIEVLAMLEQVFPDRSCVFQRTRTRICSPLSGGAVCGQSVLEQFSSQELQPIASSHCSKTFQKDSSPWRRTHTGAGGKCEQKKRVEMKWV